MEVRTLGHRAGPLTRTHGPYWLWPTDGKRPLKRQPEGQVKINFDYRGYLASPIRIAVVALDDATAKFLDSFSGGDLVVASNEYARAFRFDRVPPPRRKSLDRFELLVHSYEPLQPLPDELEWPPPRPTPPTEEEMEEERRQEFERQRLILESDFGFAPLVTNRAQSGTRR